PTPPRSSFSSGLGALGGAPDEPRQHHLGARPDHQSVALQVHDQPLQRGVVLRTHAGDRIRVTRHAPALDHLGMVAQRLGDVVEMQPSHPEDSSDAVAAEALATRDFEVIPNAERPLTRDTLAAADVLVIAHPSDPKWEATTNSRPPRLSDRELDAIEEFVRGGGGLIALGETEQEKYGNNLNDLLARFGLEVSNCTVQDYEHHLSAPSWVLAELENGPNGEL